MPSQANAPPFLSGRTSPNQEKEGSKHAFAPALFTDPFCEAAIKPIARVIECSSQISDWAIAANQSLNLPQRREGGPQLLNEQVGLFKGSKVTTPIKLIPVDQV